MREPRGGHLGAAGGARLHGARRPRLEAALTAATAPLRTAHASGLGAVEKELAALHRAMLRAGGEDATGVRLSVLTLVAACTSRDEVDEASRLVGAIAAEHPARALIVLADREADPGVEADLSLECSVRGGGQVCAEVARLRVGGDTALHLASVVTPLLLPDIPVHLWLPGPAPLEQALAPETAAICEHIILDTDTYPDSGATLRTLARASAQAEPPLPLKDLAWLRLTPVRELLARAVDPGSRRGLLDGVSSVEIEHSGVPAGARLLAGWIRTRLSLPPSMLSVREVRGGGDRRGIRRLHVASSEGASPAFVTITTDSGGLRTEVVIGDRTVAARDVPYEAPSTADLVGSALRDSAHDAVYAGALAAAAEPG